MTVCSLKGKKRCRPCKLHQHATDCTAGKEMGNGRMWNSEFRPGNSTFRRRAHGHEYGSNGETWSGSLECGLSVDLCVRGRKRLRPGKEPPEKNKTHRAWSCPGAGNSVGSGALSSHTLTGVIPKYRVLCTRCFRACKEASRELN